MVRTMISVTVGVAAVLMLAPVANAVLVDNGDDIFITPAFDSAEVAAGLTLAGVYSGGPIAMEGLSLQMPGLGDTDTIVRRSDGTQTSVNPMVQTFDVEIVALSLKSVDPVSLNLGSGPTPFDVFVTLNPAGSPVEDDGMTIRHDAAGDPATFDSFFDVFFDLSIAPAGSGDAPTVLGSDTLRLEITDAPWAHEPENGFNPLGGNFFPTGIIHMGPHPVIHTPAPGAALLALIGLGAARRIGRRRVARA